jgi:predicted acylesterase/phospholipase RssA
VRDIFGDYVLGRRTTAHSRLRLADAVAASAAFPGAFPPLVLREYEFPCSLPKLLDGGAYDNMALKQSTTYPAPSSSRSTRAGSSTPAASADYQ